MSYTMRRRISRLKEDYDSYVVARVRAQWFFDGAMRRYEEGVQQKWADADSRHRWWRTLRESVFGVEQSVPPLVNPATGLLVSEPDQKAKFLMHTFGAKQSSRILELRRTCHQQPASVVWPFDHERFVSCCLALTRRVELTLLGFFPCFIRR